MGNKTQRSDGIPRKITLHVRFAVDENEQLKNKAYQARVSVTEFIRRAALRKQVIESPPPPQLNWKLYEQLGKIGNNINQIAKGVNSALRLGLPVNIDVEKLTETSADLIVITKEIQLQLLECGADEEVFDGEDD
jgi:Bacterial mobilisation protein (MobC)